MEIVKFIAEVLIHGITCGIICDLMHHAKERHESKKRGTNHKLHPQARKHKSKAQKTLQQTSKGAQG